MSLYNSNHVILIIIIYSILLLINNYTDYKLFIVIIGFIIYIVNNVKLNNCNKENFNKIVKENTNYSLFAKQVFTF